MSNEHAWLLTFEQFDSWAFCVLTLWHLTSISFHSLIRSLIHSVLAKRHESWRLFAGAAQSSSPRFSLPWFVTNLQIGKLPTGSEWVNEWMKRGGCQMPKCQNAKGHYVKYVTCQKCQTNMFDIWHFDRLTVWLFVFWHFDMLTCWHFGVLTFWHLYILVFCHFGMLACWHSST